MSASDEFEALLSDEEDNTGSDLVKQLRSALKKASTENKALKTQVEEAGKVTRSTSLRKALEEHGAKPALAKYFPAEGEIDSTAVLAWLKEDGELFGWQEPERADDTPAADVSAAKDISNLRPNAGSTDLRSRVEALATAPINKATADEAGRTAAELIQLFQAQKAAGN